MEGKTVIGFGVILFRMKILESFTRQNSEFRHKKLVKSLSEYLEFSKISESMIKHVWYKDKNFSRYKDI